MTLKTEKQEEKCILAVKKQTYAFITTELEESLMLL